MALSKVAANKHHLTDAKGNPFFAIGVNYAGYFDRAWKMWETDKFDPDLITRDFRKAQNSGFNSLRLFVHSALDSDIRRGDFDKLDHVLSIAQDHDLSVMLTLNDSHSVNLPRVSETDVKIVERYNGVPTISSYDLQNEPVFYNLVAAWYPNNHPAPVQSNQLVGQYGERVSREKTKELQSQRRIPTFLNENNAYYYINALYLFLEYNTAINTFVKQGKGTYVDFMLSPEAEPWYYFIEILDKTVEAWLKSRIEPIRATGCKHLLTVGWSWQHFAVLPANRLLDFQQYHNYADMSLAGFNKNVSHLQAMRQAFPHHPIVFGEFGWSNQTTSNADTSQPVSPNLTALYEAATHAYLRANGFGGAYKWMLNDVDITYNPQEASFGVFQVGDQAKPIRDLLARFSEDWPDVSQPASFIPARDLEAGMSYRFDVPQQVTVGGHLYQDRTISWQADGESAHCFITKSGSELLVDAQGAGQLTIAPWDLIPGWDRGRESNLYRVYSDSQRTRKRSFEAGANVVVELGPGIQYAITMGASLPTEPPPGELPLPEPNAGEHVVLLGDSEQQLPAALSYIRKFGPDFTFASDEVAGRWAYVSVVATPEQVPDTVLDGIRSVGTLLVERVVDDTPDNTKAMLDDMARRGQRFLSAATPPQEEPPTEPAPEPVPEEPEEIYVVQPGDTLSGIAKKVYGDFRLWQHIFEANRDKLSNPSYIRVGMELLIPPRP